MRIVDESLAPSGRGDVVLGPVFGATAHSMFPFAYTLALNGFRVLRVDFRGHVGLSTGGIEDMALSRQAEDLMLVLDIATDPLLAAVSLSARPAIRALTKSSGVRGAVLIEPVVNVRSTLLEVMGENHLDKRPEDVPDSVVVLDYTVKAAFAFDCVQHGFVALDDTVQEVETLTMPVVFVAGDADPWVRVDEVRTVADACRAAGGDASLVTIPAASHRLNRNPAVAARYIESTARACLRLAAGDDGDDDLVMPTFDEMLRAHSAARRRAGSGVG